MSNLLPGSGAKKAAQISAASAEKQMAMQREQLSRQEAQLQSEESDLAKRTQASLRARQRGGQRVLLGDMGDQQSTLG